MISVLILTLNEEINLDSCLDSVAWSNDVVVLDSYSSDSTVDIARRKGARVIQRKFDNWASHQNWAVKSIEFENPWVLYIDADERCTPELQEEIRAIVSSEEDCGAYRIRRKDFFMGRWLRHAQLYPTWLVRIFRPENIRYERLVNPIAVVDGEIGELEGHLHHYPFSHGISHWIDRHNRYSDMEATEAVKLKGRRELHLKDLLSRDPNLRRRVMKDIFFRIPGRPLLKFLYYYIARRGFLDGYPGFTYSILQSIYEYLIVLKTNEKIATYEGKSL